MSSTLAPEREKIGYEKEDYDSDFLADVETAFEHACQWGVDPGQGHQKMPDCGKPAKWIMQARHTEVGCPGPEAYMCDEHAKIILRYWQERLMMKPPSVCKKCNVVLEGNLKVVLHAIRL